MPEERRDRRRVGALLNAYYHIEGAEGKADQGGKKGPEVEDKLDKQGCDVQQYFDDMVASGELPELVKRSEDLNKEVKTLDSTMQKRVYENYTKFMKATVVIKQMKCTVNDLQPEIERLQGSLDKVTEHQQSVDDGVATRSTQIETLLKQQRVCKKLKVLFDLPATLKRCLDVGAFGRAVEAYCNCAPFLRQYKHLPAFQKVLEQVDLQMGRIRNALEGRLASPDISAAEAVNSARTLLDLGVDKAQVGKEYLDGRIGVIHRSLVTCLEPEPPPEPNLGACPAERRGSLGSDASTSALAVKDEAGEGPRQRNFGIGSDGDGPGSTAASAGGSWHEAVMSTTASAGGSWDEGEGNEDERDLRKPESRRLQRVCTRITELLVPEICNAVEGFQKLQEGQSGPVDVQTLAEFVTARVEELCDRLSELLHQKCPPTRVLVSCIHCVRDSLRRLHLVLPRLMTKLFAAFLSRTANSAMTSLFTSAASQMTMELPSLYGECRRLQESSSAGMEEVLEAIASTEQRVIMHGFHALTGCQPLLSLLGSDRAACQQLVRSIHGQLTHFFLAFVDSCYVYVGKSEEHHLRKQPPGGQFEAQQTHSMTGEVTLNLERIGGLQWSGFFALALVRIARHLEVKAINKVWAVARDLFADDDPRGEGTTSELSADPAVVRATRGAAQVVIAQYVLVSGQRLAHFFRNSIQNRNWMTVREPRDPLRVVEMVLKEVNAFDAQLARILGDPRKPDAFGRHRSVLSRIQNPMEVEFERQWARRLPVFAPIPFNRNGAVVGILRIAFKGLCEYVREETFAKFGLQQIQLDCAFFGEVVRDFVEAEDARMLDSLLEEVVISATARCVEPVLMDTVIVETLCEEKKRVFKFESSSFVSVDLNTALAERRGCSR